MNDLSKLIEDLSQVKLLELLNLINKEVKGEEAYKQDVALRPLYHDGTPRKTWNELKFYEQETWRK